MVAMGIRIDLAPESHGKRTWLPPACYTLSNSEKRSLCESLRGVKVPHGFCSNVKRLVSMKDLKLLGLKSHDHHALMQQLLPIAIRGILPKKVRNTISRLCFFFTAICSKVIDPRVLDDLEKEAAIILCQLEMYFPPAFFDIIVHLIVHLVSEIRECGPVHLRWMYPFERYMKILKGYVKNTYRPEASIVERYVAEEAIEFCSQYFLGKGTLGGKLKNANREEVLQAHLNILNNTPEIEPYLDAHKAFIKEQNPRKNEKWLLNVHNKTFMSWLKYNVTDDASILVRMLANGPYFDVLGWQGYDINGYSFYTKEQDDKSTMQNSGVTLEAEGMHFSSSKDKNFLRATSSYFGIIEEIWEVDYITFKIPVFKCKWAGNNGVKVDELGFRLVDLSKLGPRNDQFIMANMATDDNHGIRGDHGEGIWENVPTI
ncbi:hypothetical protein CASFOL_028417 [Castilleja foliolosa]|uniref:Transposase n=1 Tax=Castilleja foliolosa TaxID=1961234 RepID=A0ABD3CCJ2_9LAMI